MASSPSATAATVTAASSTTIAQDARALASDVVERVIAASFGGTITALVATPLDVVKARLQAHGHTRSSGLVAETLDSFRTIVRTEGVATLWRGLLPTLVMTVPATALYFATYEKAKQTLHSRFESPFLRAISIPASGVFARVSAVVVTSPLELVRTNLQANRAGTESEKLLHIGRRIVERGGWRSLWGGLMPTLWRDVPFSALYWSGYEFIKHRMSLNTPDGKPQLFAHFIAGAAAGTMAAVLTNPIDVLKTRRQMYLVPKAGEVPITMLEILKAVLREDGVRGLTKGIVPRAFKVAPACAIMISSYELCKSLLHKYKSS